MKNYCIDCGKEISLQAKRCLSCSRKGKKNYFFGKHLSKEHKQKIKDNHANIFGKNNPRWKEGIAKLGSGYILIRSPLHPNRRKNNYVAEHRLVVESQIGRFLTPEEVVHHENKIKDDNRPENLMGFISKRVHRRWHGNPNSVKPKEIIFDGSQI